MKVQDYRYEDIVAMEVRWYNRSNNVCMNFHSQGT